MNNLKFIILDYLVVKKSGISDRCRDFYNWSINTLSIWKVMPSRHITKYNALRDDALHKHTQHLSVDGTATVVRQRDMLCLCVT